MLCGVAFYTQLCNKKEAMGKLRLEREKTFQRFTPESFGIAPMKGRVTALYTLLILLCFAICTGTLCLVLS